MAQNDIVQFFSLYRGLKPFEKTILYILAVSYEPFPKTNLMKVLRRCSITNNAGKPVDELSLKMALDKLINAGLVIQESYVTVKPRYAEFLMTDVLKSQRFEQIIKEVTAIYKSRGFGSTYQKQDTFLRAVRDMRIAFYRNNWDRFNLIHNAMMEHYPGQWSEYDLFRLILQNSSDESFSNVPPGIIVLMILDCSGKAINHFKDTTFLSEISRHILPHISGDDEKLLEKCMFDLSLLSNAEHMTNKDVDKESAAFKTLMSGDITAGQKKYKEALEECQKMYGKTYISSRVGNLFYLVSLIQHGDTKDIKFAEKIIKMLYKTKLFYIKALDVLKIYVSHKKGAIKKAETSYNEAFLEEHTSLSFFMFSMITTLIYPDRLNNISHRIHQLLIKSDCAGLTWFRDELRLIKGKIDHVEYGSGSDEKHLLSFIDNKKHVEPWEDILQTIETVFEDAVSTKDERLVWIVDIEQKSVEPRIQKRGQGSRFGKPLRIALKRLKDGDIQCLTEHDERLLVAIEELRTQKGADYSVNSARAFPLLCGHSHIYTDGDNENHIDLVREELKVIIEEEKDGHAICFSHEFSDECVLLQQITSNSYTVISISSDQHKLKEIMGTSRIHIPKKGEKKLAEVLTPLSRLMTVHSHFAEVGEKIRHVESDSVPFLQLIPSGRGFRMEILVRPFGKKGPAYQPGKGGEHIITTVDKQQLSVQRNFDDEIESAHKLIEKIPLLEEAYDTDFSWFFPDTESCLEIISALKDSPEEIPVEWPRGKKMSIDSTVTSSSAHLNLTQEKDWFEIDGSVALDSQEVYSLLHLIEQAAKSSTRFIELEKGRYIELEEQLYNRMRLLEKSLDDQNRIRIHTSGLHTISDIIKEGSGNDGVQAARNILHNIENKMLAEVEIPETLDVELRPYQVKGCKWAIRLSNAGFGACLADDMGLGKTVQALGVILSRANRGPTLVVAPTSVCMNWIDEVDRFAPTLNAVNFRSCDKEKALKDSRPFDIFITSYGLLVNNQMLFEKVDWSSVVFDEAQLMKNSDTRRAKAAKRLSAACKIVTTGTPIENNLEELWSLFHIINPGLLGTRKQFKERFAVPIEKNHNKDAWRTLKTLITPYILRRRKSEVLNDLPPKTELVRTVTMSNQEAAFYEALRINALDKASENETGQIEILAEITRLRRACCHPGLVLDEAKGIPGSKHALLKDLIMELLENRHKALIFSQFVDHLGMVRDLVDQMNIPYCYLDGSTPVKERERMIRDFQSGYGKLFLISLKAGGTGLNLTAADFVIHLDPWWNPAVEDQASDRAYRIGQTRPVTIYRLVTEGTVEEKIIALHKKKRELADSLLEGADMTGRLTSEELLALIKQQ